MGEFLRKGKQGAHQDVSSRAIHLESPKAPVCIEAGWIARLPPPGLKAALEGYPFHVIIHKVHIQAGASVGRFPEIRPDGKLFEVRRIPRRDSGSVGEQKDFARAFHVADRPNDRRDGTDGVSLAAHQIDVAHYGWLA